MQSKKFEKISSEAKDLINHMLEYDPKRRISALEAIDHIWIRTFAPSIKLDRNLGLNILTNLKNYKPEKKLQEATIAFIVDQLISKEEIDPLRKAFLELDTDNDGKLSLDEIANGFSTFCVSKNCENELIQIFEKVDADKNGYIGYDGKSI